MSKSSKSSSPSSSDKSPSRVALEASLKAMINRHIEEVFPEYFKRKGEKNEIDQLKKIQNEKLTDKQRLKFNYADAREEAWNEVSALTHLFDREFAEEFRDEIMATVTRDAHLPEELVREIREFFGRVTEGSGFQNQITGLLREKAKETNNLDELRKNLAPESSRERSLERNLDTQIGMITNPLFLKLTDITTSTIILRDRDKILACESSEQILDEFKGLDDLRRTFEDGFLPVYKEQHPNATHLDAVPVFRDLMERFPLILSDPERSLKAVLPEGANAEELHQRLAEKVYAFYTMPYVVENRMGMSSYPEQRERIEALIPEEQRIPMPELETSKEVESGTKKKSSSQSRSGEGSGRLKSWFKRDKKSSGKKSTEELETSSVAASEASEKHKPTQPQKPQKRDKQKEKESNKSGFGNRKSASELATLQDTGHVSKDSGKTVAGSGKKRPLRKGLTAGELTPTRPASPVGVNSDAEEPTGLKAPNQRVEVPVSHVRAPLTTTKSHANWLEKLEQAKASQNQGDGRGRGGSPSKPGLGKSPGRSPERKDDSSSSE